MNRELFSIQNKVCIVTGGGGLLGKKHVEAILSGDGVAVLLDIFPGGMERTKADLEKTYPGARIETFVTDITSRDALCQVRDTLLEKYGHIDGLINNAANNPKMEGGSKNLGGGYSFTTSPWICGMTTSPLD